MTRKSLFILVAVIVVTVFLAACHPHRWHRGCDINGLIEADAISGKITTWEIHGETAGRF